MASQLLPFIHPMLPNSLPPGKSSQSGQPEVRKQVSLHFPLTALSDPCNAADVIPKSQLQLSGN